MRWRNSQASESNVTRTIAWLTILAMFAFFWIGMASVILRIFLRRG